MDAEAIRRENADLKAQLESTRVALARSNASGANVDAADVRILTAQSALQGLIGRSTAEHVIDDVGVRVLVRTALAFGDEMILQLKNPAAAELLRATEVTKPPLKKH